MPARPEQLQPDLFSPARVQGQQADRGAGRNRSPIWPQSDRISDGQ